jgi:hypothetical protein
MSETYNKVSHSRLSQTPPQQPKAYSHQNSAVKVTYFLELVTVTVAWSKKDLDTSKSYT